MTFWRLVKNSLVHHWRMNVAVGLGVLAGTAVLTGALLVGDSVRGSLAELTLDRLGRVDVALVSDHFFRAALADELARASAFDESFKDIEPAVLMQASVSHPDSGALAGGVTLIGCRESFWMLGKGGPLASLKSGQVVLNETLAAELGAKPNQEVLLRLPLQADIPADSPLGKKTANTTTRRLTVAAVIPASGLGRFGLRPNQQQPKNAYVPLGDLQRALGQRDRVNALLVAGKSQPLPLADADARLQSMLKPKLTDAGLSLKRTSRGYFSLTATGMVLSPAAESTALRALGAHHPQSVLTYLANYITAGPQDEGKIPYSTVAALNLTEESPLGPLLSPEGEPYTRLADRDILLNRWAADDMAKQGINLVKGDTLRLTYFDAESTHGRVHEQTESLRFAGVVALEGAAADRDLTPEVKGVTDEDSIANWDPPFPYDPDRVRSAPPNDLDEQYWDAHRATPKAFVSLATGKRLWQSRFGHTTSIRVPPDSKTTEQSLTAALETELASDAASLGLAFQPVKRMGLEAATGTTPFNMLFLGFSMFIIASAVMLVGLLFRLGAERRASEVGLMTAVGLTSRQVRRLLLAEGLAVAALGGLAGTVAGAGYAWLMLVALRTPGWWLAAVGAPFLRLHITGFSLAVGFASGVLVSLLAIAWAVRQMRGIEVRRLLAGQVSDAQSLAPRPARLARLAALVSLGLALVLGVAASRLNGEAQAGAFFGSGALVLTSALAWIWSRLRAGDTRPLVSAGGSAVARLAVRNGARNPGRSTLSIGLVAAASFLIIAISAFRLEQPQSTSRRTSGSGGFALMAESAQSIVHDLSSDDGRSELGFSTADSKRMEQCKVASLRVQPGDDASCLNLYQTQQPRVLGVPASLMRRGGFAWGATAAKTRDERLNPWLLLEQQSPDAASKDAADKNAADKNAPVPVVIDASTAQYSLHVGLGEVYEVSLPGGGRLRMQVVGLLKNSIFQGSLLISERAFVTHFPGVSGYQMFLIEAQGGDVNEVEKTLETTLADQGFDVQHTSARLADLMAVQNTYLSTFQSLGGLGLLLGTFGLAVVQLRNVLERRGELALLRATGFRRLLLAWLVLLENGLLLAGGLFVGVGAALVAVLPHLISGGAGIPWLSLAATLALVLGVGLLAGLLAVRDTLRAPVVPALRGD